MAFFEEIEIQKLFCAEEADIFPPFTEKDLAETEKAMGWKLPASYLALLNIKNGGRIDEAYEESWLSVIYGISSNGKGLADWYDNWINEWQYPNIGIPFGETQSAGHDLYFMDYRAVDENGEPRIVLIDNEMNNAVTVVAKNLEEFLTKIYHHEEVRGSRRLPDVQNRIRRIVNDGYRMVWCRPKGKDCCILQCWNRKCTGICMCRQRATGTPDCII